MAPTLRTLNGEGTLLLSVLTIPQSQADDGAVARLTVGEYFDGVYLPFLELRGRCERSIEVFRQVVALWRSLGFDKPIGNIAVDDVAVFLGVIAERRLPATVRCYRRHLGLILEAARPGCFTLPLEARTRSRVFPRPWAAGDVARIIEAAGDEPGFIGPIPSRLFWPAMISFRIGAGVTLGQTLMVKLSDVDLETRTVKLRKSPKANGRLAKFQPLTAEAIAAIWAPPRGLLFPLCSIIDRADALIYLSTTFRRIVVRAGLDPLGRSLRGLHRLNPALGTRST